MPFLTELLGKRVLDSDEQPVGKLSDVVVAAGGEPYPLIAGIVIEGSQGTYFAKWSQVERMDGFCLLNIPLAQLSEYRPRDTDILLRKDVLDKQIVDIHDYRVVRVNDVSLAPVRDGLRLIGVDAGMRGVFRRMGLEKVAERLARLARVRFHTDLIGWGDVETLQSGGGAIRLKVPIDKMAKLHPADIADIVAQLDPVERTEVMEQLDVETAAEALAEAEPELQVSILESLEDKRASDILEEMEPDEAADLLADLPADRSEELLSLMEAEDAADVKELLAYDEMTAGGMMTTEYIALPPHLTAQEAIEELRRLAADAETVYYVYIVNEEEQLLGVVSLREIIVAVPQTRIEEFMETNVVRLHVEDRPAEVAQMIRKYGLIALPVVDDFDRMQGIVTFDDVLDLLLPED